MDWFSSLVRLWPWGSFGIVKLSNLNHQPQPLTNHWLLAPSEDLTTCQVLAFVDREMGQWKGGYFGSASKKLLVRLKEAVSEKCRTKIKESACQPLMFVKLWIYIYIHNLIIYIYCIYVHIHTHMLCIHIATLFYGGGMGGSKHQDPNQVLKALDDAIRRKQSSQQTFLHIMLRDLSFIQVPSMTRRKPP